MTSQSKPFEEPEASEVLRWRPLWITMTTSSVASSSTMWGEPETSGGHVTTSSLGDDPVSFPAHALIPTNYRHFTNVQNKSALSAFPVACPGSAMHVSLPAEDFYSTGTKWCQDKVAGTKIHSWNTMPAFLFRCPCLNVSFSVHAWVFLPMFMPECLVQAAVAYKNYKPRRMSSFHCVNSHKMHELCGALLRETYLCQSGAVLNVGILRFASSSWNGRPARVQCKSQRRQQQEVPCRIK